jgi:type I restriction enzyme M protein
MGKRNRELLEKIEKLCLDRAAEDSGISGPRQDILGLVFLRFVYAAAEEYRRALRSAAPSAGPDAAEDRRAGEGPDRIREKTQEPQDARGGVFFVSEGWDRIFPGGEDPGDGPALTASIRALERENPALRDLFPGLLRRAAGRPSSQEPPAGAFTLELGRLLGGLSSLEAARVFIKILAEFETGAAGLLRGRASPAGPAPFPPAVPHSIAGLLALMLEPYQGRLCDPCCGSAGLSAAAADFVTDRQGKLPELFFYAQERNAEAWRLARMNLMVRGIDTSEILLNAEGPLQRDPRRDLKFDFIAASPPPGDPYPWIRYTLDRLSAGGLGALILPHSSLASPQAEERELRRSLVEGRLLDCVVNLPARIFNAHSPRPSVWFFSRAKLSRGRRGNEVLFIDARNLGRALNRRQWELSAEDINRIARTYHNWRFPKAVPYRDIRSFALSAHITQIRAAAYSLNPALYLGIPEEDEVQGGQFEALRAEFEALVREESRLSRQALEALRKIRAGDLG